jgi:hypothetical protein
MRTFLTLSLSKGEENAQKSETMPLRSQSP